MLEDGHCTASVVPASFSCLGSLTVLDFSVKYISDFHSLKTLTKGGESNSVCLNDNSPFREVGDELIRNYLKSFLHFLDVVKQFTSTYFGMQQ